MIERIAGKPSLLFGNFDLAQLDYATSEFFITGTATSYELERKSADYTTRIVAVLPVAASKFNGTVVVEWLNVTGGLDMPATWVTLHRELIRGGYGYIAVSAQKAGVEGGPNLGRGTARPLKTADPQRYGGLSHPGDAFSFDIYSQVVRLLRGREAAHILGTLCPERVIAIGDSQSAFFLTTYINVVDPLGKVFDAFLLHARFGVAATLEGHTPISSPQSAAQQEPRLRDDLRVPVMQVITETDLAVYDEIGFHRARQPDSDLLRTWEIAGTAHGDNYTYGVGFIDSGSASNEQLAAAWAPRRTIQGFTLEQPMNNGPQHHYVTQAALWHLDQWVRNGVAPAKAQLLELDHADTLRFACDANGNAKGGVRTPWVDVPIARLSGLGGTPPVTFVGTSMPFDDVTLARLYPRGRSEYLEKFATSLDATIAAGFILAADKQEILDLARHSYAGPWLQPTQDVPPNDE